MDKRKYSLHFSRSGREFDVLWEVESEAADGGFGVAESAEEADEFSMLPVSVPSKDLNFRGMYFTTTGPSEVREFRLK